MSKRLLAALLVLVLSGTAAFAQPPGTQHLVITSAVQAPIVHVHVSEAHKRCHSSATPRLEIALPLPPADMPCGGEHSCCVSPGPANVPEVTSTSSQQRPDAHPTNVPPGQSVNPGARPVMAVFSSGSLLPSAALSTVLRI